VFIPFLRWRGTGARRAVELALIGAIQFGAMYAFYTRSFGSLKAYEAALATIMTPLYVTLLDDVLERHFRPAFLLCAMLAALGTAVSLGVLDIGFKGFSVEATRGLLLIQASNLCFAVGQVWFRRVMGRSPGLSNPRAFAWCAVGAVAVAVLAAAPAVAVHGLPVLTTTQLWVLLYLGVIASGVCFFLWNVGARGVNAGTLAVMNNLKIPLGMLVALVVFSERAAWMRLTAGLAMIVAALLLATFAHRKERRLASGFKGESPI
jgi:drug/metabolite transporter (DMT)-like permease